MKVSPLAPASYPTLKPIDGVRMAAVECQIRYKGRPDLMLMAFDEGTAVAGALTRSTTAGPPVEWCRAHLAGGTVRAIAANSGNANAYTGQKGHAIVRASAEKAAEVVGCKASEVFIASTGVIGEPPPLEKLTAGIENASGLLKADAWMDTARAIMTTDTFPKVATRQATIDGKTVTINGIAKGSGMIAPDMATMLVFIATDAAIAPKALQDMTDGAVERTFNCITVDSDTSTSDTLITAATGKAGNTPVSEADDPRAADFAAAYEALCMELAHLVIRDGEGATKFVEIEVTGAKSDKDAKQIALSIANAPLVKTAIAGSDPNWGRILMAVGKSGIALDQRDITVTICGIRVTENGAVAPSYVEADAAALMKKDDISIGVDIAQGKGRSRVWTCDLTHGYIDINVSYRS
ncbi:MAG: bifunctional glutamate N-acetyltransferase/amino-acid acetyltransferase ArgJ [Rhodobiaceae bacterium]|nr:bifunctional glutamate N-acetyltransferase/amino-acid acetyltransferase ArgJ [Rhodobiaceae bacterium]MCC0055172.1 bifunctional glutamate N-acetyltransferase/amino-acid acetyltransferase ArgJ [Rhodobiaceae bacterium]